FTQPSPATGGVLIEAYTIVNFSAGTQVKPIDIEITNTGLPQYGYANGQPATGYLGTGATSVADGLPHMLVQTVTQASSGDVTIRLYLDGVLILGPTTTSPGQMLAAPARS